MNPKVESWNNFSFININKGLNRQARVEREMGRKMIQLGLFKISSSLSILYIRFVPEILT